jgi:hypothetical protein
MTWLQQVGIDRPMAEQIAAAAARFHDTLYTPPFTDDQLWVPASGVAQNCWDIAAGKITWPAIADQTYAGDSAAGATRADSQNMIDFERQVLCPIVHPDAGD